MPERRFYNPNNPKQQYRTIIPNDPNIPAGYLDTQGLDGATPEAMKQFTAGVNNQGAGAAPTVLPGYSDGDPQQRIDQPNWPNGILNSPSGNQTQIPTKWP